MGFDVSEGMELPAHFLIVCGVRVSPLCPLLSTDVASWDEQVAWLLAVVAVAVVVCVCFIAQANLRGVRQARRVALEGLGAGGELEDERASSAAINIAVKTGQTDLLTFPAEFNATLADIGANVDETDTASEEGVAEKEINAQYAAGTDPW